MASLLNGLVSRNPFALAPRGKARPSRPPRSEISKRPVTAGALTESSLTEGAIAASSLSSDSSSGECAPRQRCHDRKEEERPAETKGGAEGRHPKEVENLYGRAGTLSVADSFNDLLQWADDDQEAEDSVMPMF
mmetsp:Transcript_52033/g.111363  ORF Transcript_52033/g.111363 Transcript_52033/m.111363 type:complete len:134 (+) Transcript_52033:170-571(+)